MEIARKSTLGSFFLSSSPNDYSSCNFVTSRERTIAGKHNTGQEFPSGRLLKSRLFRATDISRVGQVYRHLFLARASRSIFLETRTASDFSRVRFVIDPYKWVDGLHIKRRVYRKLRKCFDIFVGGKGRWPRIYICRVKK